ncbi:transcription factor HES-3 [Sorex araneus]|uniref:transcription factor HES-3 n=1 Tax=Sorex araneus TaxID=42254 RepID=UPI002433F384|nr:transcription factor HES-3 [Sorex araneus]XP_054993574.1 transcription factor HES-3 [Sorex araneus]
MEKKRRARINRCLEQLRALLEKHYSHQIRKRKLEKADILELSVKYMKSLQGSAQGLWPLPSAADYASGFRGCSPGVHPLLPRREEAGGGLRCPLAHGRAGGSTMDSAGARARAPARWGPAPGPAPPAALPGAPAPPPAPARCSESPGPGLRVWRPW